MKLKMIQGEHYNLHGKCVFTRANPIHEVDDKTGERLLAVTVKRRDGEGHPTGTQPRFERVAAAPADADAETDAASTAGERTPGAPANARARARSNAAPADA